MNIIADYFNKFKENKTLLNGSLFSIYSFIGKGINFLILLILAKYISPEQYGYLNLFVTIVSFLTIFIGLSTNGYLSISFFKYSENEFKRDFASIYTIGLITLVFFLLVCIIEGEKIGRVLSLSSELLVCAVIIAFFTYSFLLQQDYLRIKEKINTYGLYNVSSAVSYLFLSAFLVVSLSYGWKGQVSAQLIYTTLFGVLSVAYLYKNNLLIFNCDKDRFLRILSWGIPMIPHNATGWIRQGLDRYIVSYYYTIYDVGIFSFALNISNIIEMIGMAFNSTNSVTLFQILSDDTKSNFEKRDMLSSQSKLTGKIYVISTIGVIISVTLLTYLFLPQYIDSLKYFWIISLCGLLKCIYFLFCNYLFYFNETKHLMYITFFTSLLHVTLSFALTRYSLILTAFVYVIIQFIVLYLVVKESQKLIARHLPIS